MTDPIQPLLQTPTAEETDVIAQVESVEPYPTVAQIMQVCPDSNIDNVRKHAPYLLKALAEGGFTSKNQLIGAIATVYTEVTQFAPIEEYGKGAGKSYPPFYGRGYVQLTWRTNYEQAERELGIAGLVADPSLALGPENAARIFAWYWSGATGNNPAKAAESGNWRETRRSVNGGYHGWEKFKGAIDRGLEVFTEDLDPSAIGAIPVDGSYGLGCADSGGAANRTINGLNPGNQLDALLYALGLHARDRQHGYEFRGYINVASAVEALKLDAQKTFSLTGVDPKSDGEYTVDEIIFYPLARGGIKAYVVAHKPDPDAPAPQIFLHDTNAGLSVPSIPTNAPVGDIPGKIYAAGMANKGKSSATGPGGGNVACAWATNLFCVLPAGLQNIGDVIGQDGVTVAVKSMTRALEGGRGQKVSRAEAVRGDIWISPGEGHVGIITEDGGGRVLSNSSSRASFVWEDTTDRVNGYYGGGPEHGIYRVLN